MSAKQDIGASEWVDPDDAPELTEDFFANAAWYHGAVPIPTPPKRGRPKSDKPKTAISLRLDQDVVAHFKAEGPGWQSRINETLRQAIGRRVRRK